MSRTYKDSKFGKGDGHIRVRGQRAALDEQHLRKISRALIELARLQLEAEAQTEGPAPKEPKSSDDRQHRRAS